MVIQRKILKEHQLLRSNHISTVCKNKYEVVDVEEMLRELNKKKHADNIPLHSLHVMSMMGKFLECLRLDSKENILKFWHKNKNNMPELYELAKIAFPVLQCELVSRDYSLLWDILIYRII